MSKFCVFGWFKTPYEYPNANTPIINDNFSDIFIDNNLYIKVTDDELIVHENNQVFIISKDLETNPSNSIIRNLITNYSLTYASLMNKSPKIQKIVLNENYCLFYDSLSTLYFASYEELIVIQKNLIVIDIDIGQSYALVIVLVENSKKLYSIDLQSTVFTLVSIDLPNEPLKISIGNNYSIIITENGSVYEYGSVNWLFTQNICHLKPNLIDFFEGIGLLLPNGISTGSKLCCCGFWHTIIVADGTNDVFGFGWNNFNQIGINM